MEIMTGLNRNMGLMSQFSCLNSLMDPCLQLRTGCSKVYLFKTSFPIFKKQGIIAIFAGGITGIILFMVVLNAYHLFNTLPYVPPIEDTEGSIIAEQLENKEANISYIWIYNNTWVNVNLSTYYSRLIDGILVGSINGTFAMALIHEPSAEIAQGSYGSLSFFNKHP